MLGHPEAAIAPALGMGGEVARIVDGAARVGVLRDATRSRMDSATMVCSR
jgi:hypothetical protein